MKDVSYLRKSRSGRIFDGLNVVFLLLLFLIMVYPFYQQLIVSLNEGIDADRAPLYFWPRRFTLENYEWLFQHSGIPHGFVISVLRVVVGTVSGLACTSMHRVSGIGSKASAPGAAARLFPHHHVFWRRIYPTYLLYTAWPAQYVLRCTGCPICLTLTIC